MGSLFSQEGTGGHGHSHGHGHTHGHGHSHGEGMELDQEKWNNSADWYDKMPEVDESANFYVSLLKNQDWWTPGLTILDYGCGPGHALIKLGPDLAKGVGFDLSPAMIKRCKEKAKDAKLEHKLEFKQLKSERGEDIEGEEEDIVLCAYVLHHVSGDEDAKHEVFDRLCDATKPGGHFMICEFESEFSKEKIQEWMAKKGISLTTSSPYSLKMNIKSLSIILREVKGVLESSAMASPGTSGNKQPKEQPKLSRETWDEIAEIYDEMKAVEESAQYYTDILKKQEWWKPGLTLLDFGCGPGHALVMLGPDLRKGVGYELSNAMIKRGQEKVKAAKLEDKISFKQLESDEGKDIEGEQVDVVLCAYVLQYIPKEKVRHETFNRLSDATKPGGYLMFCEHAQVMNEEKIRNWMKQKDILVKSTYSYTDEVGDGQVLDCVICLGRKEK